MPGIGSLIREILKFEKAKAFLFSKSNARMVSVKQQTQ